MRCFAIILLLAIAFASACNQGSAPGADASQKVSEAFGKLKTTYPYRVSETVDYLSSTSTAQHQVRSLDVAGAGRMHLKVTGFDIGEWVTTGGQLYDFSGGHWRRIVAEKSDWSDGGRLIAANMKSATDDGVETVNGIPCLRYALTFQGQSAAMAFKGEGKTWIAIADGLPLQLDADLMISTTSTNKMHAVYDYPVSIDIPTPKL